MTLNGIPPTALVLSSIVAIQFGAAIATNHFPALGVSGTTAVRLVVSALVLAFIARRRLKTFSKTFTSNWQILLPFGLRLMATNFFFYQSIARIPMGAAVAIEFIGPLTVAVLI